MRAHGCHLFKNAPTTQTQNAIIAWEDTMRMQVTFRHSIYRMMIQRWGQSSFHIVRLSGCYSMLGIWDVVVVNLTTDLRCIQFIKTMSQTPSCGNHTKRECRTDCPTLLVIVPCFPTLRKTGGFYGFLALRNPVF